MYEGMLKGMFVTG